MFIRCSRFLSLIFRPTVYHGHELLLLLLGNERIIWSVTHINASWNMSKSAWVHEYPDPTPQRHAGNIPGIRLSHNVYAVFVEVTLRCFTPTYPNFKTNFHGMNTRLTLSYVGNTRTPYKFQVFSSLATAYLQYAIIKSFHPSQAWQPFFNPLL